MTITLSITRPKERKFSIEMIPIATMDAWRRLWAPGAQEIGAYWLPLFEGSVWVHGKDFEEVSMELMSFRNWLQSQSFDEGLKQEITSRVDLLLNGLKTLYAESGGDIEVLIG
jgi:hypothetical protein